jgi:hypothetical protein
VLNQDSKSSREKIMVEAENKLQQMRLKKKIVSIKTLMPEWNDLEDLDIINLAIANLALDIKSVRAVRDRESLSDLW